MDDKSLNLWRQIEGGRRATRRPVRPARPDPIPAKAAGTTK